MVLTPNRLTLLALPFAFLSAVSLYKGSFGASVFWILLVSACDLLDGTLAKKKKMATPFGGFLDSTVDRVTDLFLFMGILFFYGKEGSFQMMGVTFWAMGGSFLVSYTRARAENVIENCRVGFWERPERIGLFLLGLVSGHLKTALWILALGVTLTACHRIFYTRRVLKKQGSLSPFQKILFWDYPRNSWPYRAFVLLVAILTLILK